MLGLIVIITTEKENRREVMIIERGVENARYDKVNICLQ